MLSIVIPTYRRNKMLKQHVDALLDGTNDLSFEVIIVNDCKLNDVAREKHWPYKVRVINNPKSGVASARNFGLCQANYDWILFLDDDMLLNKSNLETYLTYCNSETDKTLNLDWEYTPETIRTLEKRAFGRFLIESGFTSLKGWCNLEEWSEPVQLLEGLTSQNLLIHKDTFNRLNGYNENFPFAGAEDFEFAQRAKQIGIRNYVDTTSVMFHNELDRLNEKEWFSRKKRGGTTQRIAYEMGYKQMLIPEKTKFKFPRLLNAVGSSILFFSSKSRLLDRISFKVYKAILGQNLHAGFYNYPKE